MIGEKIKEYLVNDKLDIVKPADEVAVVNSSNSLEHAMLLLTADQYSVIPVLDNDSKVIGLISLSKIMKSIIGMNEVRYDKLNDIAVDEIVNNDFIYVYEDFVLEDVMNKLVKTSFIVVVDKENYLKGIITRSEILKGLNRIAHNLEEDYTLVENIKKLEKADEQLYFT